MLCPKRGVSSRGALDRYSISPSFRPSTSVTIPAIAKPESAATVAVKRFPDAKTGSFDATNTIFSQEFPIRGYEAEPNQHASMVTIANLLQELAGNHAVGMWGRAEKGFAALPNAPDIIFVMTRLQVRMTEYPKWGDIVEMETYFNEESKLTAKREWVISLPASKRKIGAATSTWVNINMSTRRITKLPDELKEPLKLLAGPENRHAIPVDETKKKLQEFDRSSGVKGISQIARRSDMDMNGHINNVSQSSPHTTTYSHLNQTEFATPCENFRWCTLPGHSSRSQARFTTATICMRLRLISRQSARQGTLSNPTSISCLDTKRAAS